MQVIVNDYFKDSRGVWHQPGNKDEFPDDEVEKLEKTGAITVVRTAMVGPPHTRGNRRKKNEHIPQ